MSTINPTNREFNWSYVQRFFVSPGAAPFGLRLQGRFWGRGPKSGRRPAGNDPISRVPRHLLRQRHDFMAIFFRKSNVRFHIPAPAQRYVSPSKKLFCPRFSILYGWDCIGIYMMKLKATLLAHWAHCLLASSKLPCWLSAT